MVGLTTVTPEYYLRFGIEVVGTIFGALYKNARRGRRNRTIALVRPFPEKSAMPIRTLQAAGRLLIPVKPAEAIWHQSRTIEVAKLAADWFHEGVGELLFGGNSVVPYDLQGGMKVARIGNSIAMARPLLVD